MADSVAATEILSGEPFRAHNFNSSNRDEAESLQSFGHVFEYRNNDDDEWSSDNKWHFNGDGWYRLKQGAVKEQTIAEQVKELMTVSLNTYLYEACEAVVENRQGAVEICRKAIEAAKVHGITSETCLGSKPTP